MPESRRSRRQRCRSVALVLALPSPARALAGRCLPVRVRLGGRDGALAVDHEGRDIRVVGVVSGLPSRFENGLRFDFSVEQAEAALPAHLSLAWYRG